MSERFPKSRRLLRRSEFLEAQRRAVGVRARDLVLLYYGRGDDRPPRLGLVASRKMGNAVARNRAKRRIREWFRRRQPPPPAGADIVVIPRSGVTGASWPELCGQLDRSLAKAHRKWQDAGAGGPGA